MFRLIGWLRKRKQLTRMEVSKMPESKMEKKEFARKAIERCRTGKYKGIHTVYSGFNTAWREYYGKDEDPVVGVNKLIADGHITGHGAKGGFQIGLPEDAKSKAIQVTLDKILND